jgi:xylan 1,4-beta-xylosidase
VLRRHLSPALASLAVALPSPVLAGDWPDPSVIRTDEGYAAVVTSSSWAPIFRILRTPDLREWRLTGQVLGRLPRWAEDYFWAPELARLRSGYAVFYSAHSRRRHKWFCVSVATAPAIEGPWRDAGRPLRCGRYGSLDPFPTRDERGRLVLLWKEDGNQFGRPTRIFAQRLREDGRRLLGRPKKLIRNDRRWEKRAVEAPAVVRRSGYFYLFYSGGLCCSRRCHYAVGVARSRRLFGRWRKYRRNPLLRSGNGWRCPGHASFVDNGGGGFTAVFHAYRGGEERLAGRQLLTAPVTFGGSGWPAIGSGRPSAPAPGAASTQFDEDFSKPTLDTGWEWPLRRAPGIAVGDGLRLRASGGAGVKLDGGALGRRLGMATYRGTAVVDATSLAGGAMAGLASYRSPFELIGISASRDRAVVWRRRKGRYRRLLTRPLPPSGLIYLRMAARGERFQFDVSIDGIAWYPVGGPIRGPVEESARVALTVGGSRLAAARFLSAKVE